MIFNDPSGTYTWTSIPQGLQRLLLFRIGQQLVLDDFKYLHSFGRYNSLVLILKFNIYR